MAAFRINRVVLDADMARPVKQKRSFRAICACPNCIAESSGLPPIKPPNAEGKRIHICPFPGCDRSFLRPSLLKYHNRYHTGEKPFACTWPSCDKCFTRSDYRHRHMKIHCHNKVLTCKFCDKKFNRKDHLTRHVRTHKGKKEMKKRNPSTSVQNENNELPALDIATPAEEKTVTGLNHNNGESFSESEYSHEDVITAIESNIPSMNELFYTNLNHDDHTHSNAAQSVSLFHIDASWRDNDDRDLSETDELLPTFKQPPLLHTTLTAAESNEGQYDPMTLSEASDVIENADFLLEDVIEPDYFANLNLLIDTAAASPYYHKQVHPTSIKQESLDNITNNENDKANLESSAPMDNIDDMHNSAFELQSEYINIDFLWNQLDHPLMMSQSNISTIGFPGYAASTASDSTAE